MYSLSHACSIPATSIEGGRRRRRGRSREKLPRRPCYRRAPLRKLALRKSQQQREREREREEASQRLFRKERKAPPVCCFLLDSPSCSLRARLVSLKKILAVLPSKLFLSRFPAFFRQQERPQAKALSLDAQHSLFCRHALPRWRGSAPLRRSQSCEQTHRRRRILFFDSFVDDAGDDDLCSRCRCCLSEKAAAARRPHARRDQRGRRYRQDDASSDDEEAPQEQGRRRGRFVRCCDDAAGTDPGPRRRPRDRQRARRRAGRQR